MNSKKLKVALGDVRHSIRNRRFKYFPIGISFIGSYLLSQFEPGEIELRLYTEPEELIKDIDEWQPDIVAVSNYMWNSALSYVMLTYARKKIPGVLAVMGGQEFPKDIESQRHYLAQRPEVDMYVYADGEFAFAGLVKSYLEKGRDISLLKSEVHEGIIFLDPKTGEPRKGDLIPRVKDMDIIPSPYLTGLLDKWLYKDFFPTVQTMRGCPYNCAYCKQGNEEQKGIGFFSFKRIKAELDYIAEIRKDSTIQALAFLDSNFGMYQRDVKISKYISKLMDKYNWPKIVTPTTGKANFDRILKIQKILKNRMPVCLSQQSMYDESIKTLNRKNIPVKELGRVSEELVKRKHVPYCELIIPLPEETLETFLKGQDILTSNGVYFFTYYTTHMLKGTLLESKEYREKYGMQIKYKPIPHQFGEYQGEKCFEIIEVCVGTNTMPFKHYLDCFGIGLIMCTFSSIQFDIIRKHIIELGINYYQFIYEIWQYFKTNKKPVYQDYMEETKSELFDTWEDAVNHLSKPENYKKLLDEEIGEIVIEKYIGSIIEMDFAQLLEVIYSTLKKLMGEVLTQDIGESLEAAQKWMLAVRNVNKLWQSRVVDEEIETLELPYDIVTWYYGKTNHPLIKFKRASKYNVFYDRRRVFNSLNLESSKLSDEKIYEIRIFLRKAGIRLFWRDYQVIRFSND
jgi:radical SAM superfamily enzyme YgiQ (UPF0313 family)